jgi:hypothetical protein
VPFPVEILRLALKFAGLFVATRRSFSGDPAIRRALSVGTLAATGADCNFAACLSLWRLALAANSECEPSRSVSLNRAFPASKCLNFFGSTREVADAIFAIPVGLFGFESDVDLTIATDFSIAEIFLSLCYYLHML